MRISGMKTGLDVDSLVQQLMEVERKPLQSLEKKKSTEESKTTAWNDLNEKLEKFLELTENLKTEDGFAERTVTLSEETIATVTGGADSTPGSLDLEVRSLATAQRVETGIFSSLTTALGLAGTVIIDGKAIAVTADDTLESIQAKIIQQNIGATCRAVKLAESQYKLVIMSNGMGATSALSYTDSEASAVYAAATSNAGVATAAISGNAAAGDYSVNVTALATSHQVQSDSQATRDVGLGYTGQFTLNGATISVAASDSLDQLANTINNTNSGVTASVYDQGGTFALRFSSNTSGQHGAVTFGDQNGVLRGLGVLTGVLGVKNQVTAATDASYTINGAAHTSATNAVTAVSGVSMTLAGVGTATVSVSATGGVLRGLGMFDSTGALAHEAVKAQDAVFSIDGSVFQRSTNNITDSVAGLTINLKKTGTTTVEIDESSTDLLKNIKDWVGKYNEIIGFIKDKTKYDLKAKSGGVLTSDNLARDLLSRMNNKAIYAVPTLTAFNSLDDIGITIGKYNSDDANKLVIDEEVLKEKLESNRTDIMKLFGAPTADVPSPTDGVAVSMWTLVDSYVHSRTGLVPRHTESLNLNVDSIQQRLEDMQLRVTRREAELYRKYSSMEVALSRLQNQMGTLNRII